MKLFIHNKSKLTVLVTLLSSILLSGLFLYGDVAAQGGGQPALLIMPAGPAPVEFADVASPQAITDPILFNQAGTGGARSVDPVGNAAPAQAYPNGVNYTYIYATDDFTIPTSVVNWTVTQAKILGVATSVDAFPLTVNSATVHIFPDAGGVPSGTPANPVSAVYTANLTAANFDLLSGTPYGGGLFAETDFEVTLPTPAVLTPGTYWFSFHITQNFNDGATAPPYGSFFWRMSSVSAGASMYGIYSDDVPSSTCLANQFCTVGQIGYTATDLAFNLYGAETPLGTSTLFASPNPIPIAEDDPAVTTITVSLTSPPNPGETITVNVAFDGTQTTVNPTTLIFTETNFTGTLTLDAIADGITEDPTPANITLTTTSSLGGVSPLDGLTETIFVTVFDFAGEIIIFVPNLGMVELEVPEDIVPALQEPGGQVIRRDSDQSEIFLPNDFDGNGFDMMQITDFQIDADGTVWFALWLGSSNFGWIQYLPATMRIEGDIVHLIN